MEIIVKRYSTRADERSSPKISFEHYVQLCARLTMLNGLFANETNEQIGRKKNYFLLDLMQQKSTNDSPRNVCSFSIDEVRLANCSCREKKHLSFIRSILVHATGTQSVI